MRQRKDGNVWKLKTALEYVMRVKVMRMSEVKGYDCIKILKASHDLYQLSFETNDHFTSQGQGFVMNDRTAQMNSEPKVITCKFMTK